MSAFEWDDSFSVGVLQVDQHNKNLLKLFCDLYRGLIEQSDMRRTKFQFEELSDYIVYHFACEEIWMGRTDYRLIPEHREGHKQIKQMLVNIYKTYQHGDISVAKRLSTLANSVIAHIKESDTTYGNFAHDKLSAKLMTKRH
jgi:hemerythrin